MTSNASMSESNTPVPLPQLPQGAHKGLAGSVLCLCGSSEMPGAAVLCVRAAQRAGAGLVTLAVFQRDLINMVANHSPETIFMDLSRTQDLFAGRLPRVLVEGRQHARLVGPGMGPGGRTRELVRRLVEDDFDGPLVLDADALNVLSGSPEVVMGCKARVVLTPHPGEAARLLEREVPSDDAGRLDVALELSERSGAVCVLKGQNTVVTDGERTFVNPTGGPAMATAGAGDVLAGIAVAYLARSERLQPEGFDTFAAVCAAVYVHGRAGDLAAAKLGQTGVIASDLIEHLPLAQRELDEARS